MIPIFAVVMAYRFILKRDVEPHSLLARYEFPLPFLITHGAGLAVLLDHARERRFRVVVEEAEPAFARGAREEAALGFERLDGVEVVAHDPGERDVRASRDEVGEAVERAPAALPRPARPRARVAGSGFEAQAGQDFVAARNQLKLSCLGERSPLF